MRDRSWQLLQDLLNHWDRDHPRRAKGGVWALAGFGLQAAMRWPRTGGLRTGTA